MIVSTLKYNLKRLTEHRKDKTKRLSIKCLLTNTYLDQFSGTS